jgi:hypothetical protein
MALVSSEKNSLQHPNTSSATIMAKYHALIDLAVSASETGEAETSIRRRLCVAYQFAYRHRVLLRQARGLSSSRAATPALAAE